jgi:hypothetical protein
VVDGGWIKTWYEHMLEIERRRLTLAGHGAAELNTIMKRVEEFYSGYLLDRLPPREIFARRPESRESHCRSMTASRSGSASGSSGIARVLRR